MQTSTSRMIQYLALDSLIINTKLARRLPANVAFRYHALPLAEDNSRITVAMADPDNEVALEAVTAALGTRPYIVQSDSTAIDTLLAEVWPEESDRLTRLLVYQQAGPEAARLQGYAEYMSALLGDRLAQVQPSGAGAVSLEGLAEAALGYDLVILEPGHVWEESSLEAVEQVPCSALIVREPRWPLRRLLLIVRGQGADSPAVEWTVRLAQPSNADATVLALVPAPAPVCEQAGHLQNGLAQWLATDTAWGQQMRRIAQRLSNWETKGTLRLRQGPAEWQIQCEVAEGDYDLIIVAADPRDRGSRQPQGELVAALLHGANRPVLIAKPKYTRRPVA